MEDPLDRQFEDLLGELSGPHTSFDIGRLDIVVANYRGRVGLEDYGLVGKGRFDKFLMWNVA